MKAPAQRTIAREGSLSGIGLHSGLSSEVFFRPAAIDSGIRFLKNGVPVSWDRAESGLRCTAVGEGDGRILTVEHAMAALAGLGICNVVVDVRGGELPGLDGSAGPYAILLSSLGVVDQGKPRSFFRPTEPIFVHEKTAAIAAFPCDEFRVTYTLDYPHPRLRAQSVDFSPRSAFVEALAPARTFCTAEEAMALKSAGLGLGANSDNTVVMGADGPQGSRLRFEDECARHKLLDLVGDLAFLDFYLFAHVAGIRSGHALNRRLAEAILRQKGN